MIKLQSAAVKRTSLGDSGKFSVGLLLTARGVSEATFHLNEEEIKAGNPDFILRVEGDSIYYERNTATFQRPDSIDFTLYFDTPAHWAAGQ